MSRKGIMLCYPFEESRLAKWEPPFIIQPKLDGDRARAIIRNKVVTLLSSEENVITSVPHINRSLEAMNLPDCELDGELYRHGLNHQLIHGIASRTVNLHSQFDDLEFHVFDMVNEKRQLLRLADLAIISSHFHPSPVHMVNFYLADDLDGVLRAYDKILEEGYEGIVVRQVDAPYVRKRSTMVMKFKPKKEDLYMIVGAQEEVSIHGEPKGTLGALICCSGEENFNVGTGFTADQRREYWKIRESLVGKVARVAYQHITSGRQVPRFPVFVEVIWDLGG